MDEIGYIIKDGLPHITKSAGSKLDYTLDVTDVCALIGANVGAFTVTATGLTVAETTQIGDAVTVILEGGIAGYKYPVHLDFDYTGTPARKDRRSIVVEVVAARM
jgi:hypothetical protein